MKGGADRLPATGPAEPLAHPADQTAQRPARRRIGASYGRGRGGALGGTDRLAKAGFDLRAKGGAAAGALIGQRLGAAGVVEMQPLQHRLRVTVCALGNARGAALLSDLIERQKALAGARMGRAHRQPTEIRRRLIPSRMVNTQHNRSV